jgi:hypothetical protein
MKEWVDPDGKNVNTQSDEFKQREKALLVQVDRLFGVMNKK